MPTELKINVDLISVLKLSSDDAEAVASRLLSFPDYNNRNDYYGSLVDVSDATVTTSNPPEPIWVPPPRPTIALPIR